MKARNRIRCVSCSYRGQLTVNYCISELTLKKLACPMCHGKLKFVTLETGDRKMAKKKAKKKVAKKTAKKTTKKTAKKKHAGRKTGKPIREDVEVILAKATSKMTVRQVFDKVNAKRKVKVSVFGVRRVCDSDLLPAKLRRKISKRKMG